mmetsp:Transcript_21646/g.67578  ORF Transcript_21646/g.67578 Transcript_21646/m.67578 type:complete len:241 (+) Transcript_21646:83-805(+)
MPRDRPASLLLSRQQRAGDRRAGEPATAGRQPHGHGRRLPAAAPPVRERSAPRARDAVPRGREGRRLRHRRPPPGQPQPALRPHAPRPDVCGRRVLRGAHRQVRGGGAPLRPRHAALCGDAPHQGHYAPGRVRLAEPNHYGLRADSAAPRQARRARARPRDDLSLAGVPREAGRRRSWPAAEPLGAWARVLLRTPPAARPGAQAALPGPRSAADGVSARKRADRKISVRTCLCVCVCAWL